MVTRLVTGTVFQPYYDWDGRKYIEILSNESELIRAKIPFRYGRVMCKVAGLRPIQDLETGTRITVLLEKRAWDGRDYWIVISVSEQENQ